MIRLLAALIALLASFSIAPAIAAPAKSCEVTAAKEVVFDDAKPSSQSYVEWKDGKRSTLDGYSAQCKGGSKEAALSERGKNSIPARELASRANSGCSFSFDDGRCLCETPSKGGSFSCRSTGLKKITEALQKSEEAAPKKASR
jgi:hypothetical protein